VEGGALGVEHVKALGCNKFVELRQKIGVQKMMQQV
jgi:hypothetical protein